MQATIVNDTERIKMRTYDQIELHSEDYTIFDDLSDRDKAIVELYDALQERVSSKVAVAKVLDNYKALFKYRSFVEKTRAIHGM